MKASIRPLAIIILSMFGFLVIVSFYADKSQFELTAREMQVRVIATDYLLDSAKVSQLDSPIFIDIRDGHDFLMDQFNQAKNVPFSRLLDEDYSQVFSQQVPKVLLSYKSIPTHEAWMLLTQLGYEQVYVLEVNRVEPEAVVVPGESATQDMGGH
ncbi:rhodanese-like domain-containing protein [Marinoscillum sp.]|uniref:rhodanese-like domain-containing protein n=1 Tax=Marinoscillum sp. TaxID=2024838 RepID=UPI003BA94965